MSAETEAERNFFVAAQEGYAQLLSDRRNRICSVAPSFIQKVLEYSGADNDRVK